MNTEIHYGIFFNVLLIINFGTKNIITTQITILTIFQNKFIFFAFIKTYFILKYFHGRKLRTYRNTKTKSSNTFYM